MIDQYRENELLRMTKDELINHIFKIYEYLEERNEQDGQWWDAISRLKQIPMFKDIYENCGD